VSSQKIASPQPSSEDTLRSNALAADPSDESKQSNSSLLSARLEPFDSFWQAPKDVEKGYDSFQQYYRINYLPHLPADKQVRILVISCGPGYLINLLKKQGYKNILGIDSDPDKLKPALRRVLPCRAAHAFEFLAEHPVEYDVIIPEQELNHLTTEETLNFLALCNRSLTENGQLIVYGLNGANPLVGSENLAHNIDHFNTFTEYSLKQLLEIAKFRDIKILPLKIYVFWKNPLNYVGLLFTGFFELLFRIIFKMYGKNVTILTKKIAASCRK
jgi:2-polyprenyl-3-methyl-5-hydroxy-6-metoxy-1,4-benzoquinol methylase